VPIPIFPPSSPGLLPRGLGDAVFPLDVPCASCTITILAGTLANEFRDLNMGLVGYTGVSRIAPSCEGSNHA
jgi:hypothetical protein